MVKNELHSILECSSFKFSRENLSELKAEHGLIKILLVGYLYDIKSERRLTEDIALNIVAALN